MKHPWRRPGYHQRYAADSMGTYNKTLAVITCPRCKAIVECAVELYFGNTTQMVMVPIGSPYPFPIGRAPQNGGPLSSESPVGTGYTECPSCNRDFHCMAEIRDGLLVSVTADMETPPYIHDREECGTMLCPKCHGVKTSTQIFNGFLIGRVVCLSNDCGYCGTFHLDGGMERNSP